MKVQIAEHDQGPEQDGAGSRTGGGRRVQEGTGSRVGRGRIPGRRGQEDNQYSDFDFLF